MATCSQHITQWIHNRQFLATVTTDYPDWIVTSAFYVALHAVDAMLTNDKVTRVCNHDARLQVLMHTNKYLNINKCFLPLYDLSRTVRYLADPMKWVPANLIEKEVFARYLYPIEKSVQERIGKDLGLASITLTSPPSPIVPAVPKPGAPPVASPPTKPEMRK